MTIKLPDFDSCKTEQQKNNERREKLRDSLKQAIRHQLVGAMDSHRAAVYWFTLMPELVANNDTDILADALAFSLPHSHGYYVEKVIG